MAEKNHILMRLSQLRDKIFPDGKGEIFLYGSRARNQSTTDSDWDILVITDDNLTSKDPFLSFAFPFAELGWELGEQITPIHYTRSQWKNASSSVFYHNVISEAIPL